MRWSELAAKEMIDIQGGERIGNMGHADLVLDSETGKIEALLLPAGSSWFGRQQEGRMIRWKHIRKIGPEMVIVEADVPSSVRES
ncbi:sporulation protein, YlmC/YmxH family [Marininema mesophilum]|uniref:Sporulation protein, YlmC/YmxH family n=1 Tax=Marininema mesophilum TaxID=1048340 RepID=A0A1H2SNL3_9BACL|nr:YlmC/YmxH family sporulation protein [Marininema mesophilum]SDW33055.1 sporulation protein, YlmC/YmxH family [Marininema mesophilum]